MDGHGVQLTEITVGNKKTKNPAFGHSAKKLFKRMKRAPKPDKPVANGRGGGDLEVHQDAYGRRYTFNAATNETKWLVDAPTPGTPGAITPSPGSVAPSGQGKAAGEEKVEVHTDGLGRRYTYNHANGESQWIPEQ